MSSGDTAVSSSLVATPLADVSFIQRLTALFVLTKTKAFELFLEANFGLVALKMVLMFSFMEIHAV